MAKLVWTEPALGDVRDIIAYIRKDSGAYARKMGQRLRQAPKVLKKNPRRGWKVPEFEVDDLREIVVGSYRIIYRILGDACYIIAVVHGSRDLTRVIRPADQDYP
jgi:toxin ParE1/3/4